MKRIARITPRGRMRIIIAPLATRTKRPLTQYNIRAELLHRVNDREPRPPKGAAAEALRRRGAGWLPPSNQSAVTPPVETEPAAPERRDLEQAAGDRDILEEMDHLILVGEVR